MSKERETPEQLAARVRETLPDHLKRPDEEIEADKAAMRLRAASFTRSKLAEEERTISHACTSEDIARANLATMNELREEGKNVSTRGGANLEMVEREQINLALALEEQGRIEEAATVHPHKTEQKRLAKLGEAIARPDGVFCECPVDKKEISGREVEADPRYEVKKIYSRVHGGMVSLVACRKCPAWNATPTPPETLALTLNAVSASHGVARAKAEEMARRGARR